MDELEAVSQTLKGHGFAILKAVLPYDLVEEMKLAVWEGTDPDRTLKRGESRTCHGWVETGPRPLLALPGLVRELTEGPHRGVKPLLQPDGNQEFRTNSKTMTSY